MVDGSNDLHRDIVDKGLSWSTGTVGLKNSQSRDPRGLSVLLHHARLSPQTSILAVEYRL
jgi:hypothetical protein